LKEVLGGLIFRSLIGTIAYWMPKSVARALSLPAGDNREVILAVTYAIVVFSIIAQGLTIGKLVKMANGLAGKPQFQLIRHQRAHGCSVSLRQLASKKLAGQDYVFYLSAFAQRRNRLFVQCHTRRPLNKLEN
jgi:hypothetical protein